MIQNIRSLFDSRDCLRIKRFPISFFAVVMGLAGFAVATQKIEIIFGFQEYMIGQWITVLAAIVFVVLMICYLAKLIRYPEEVVREFNHPITMNFFPTFSIGLLLLAIAMSGIEVADMTAGWTWLSWHCLWIAGTVIHTIFTVVILGAWVMRKKFAIEHINPAWFIPIVGNIIIPISGTELGRQMMEAGINGGIGIWVVSQMFFGIGFFFWIFLSAIILYRLIFHAPLSEKIMPTVCILIAPPAVGFIAFTSILSFFAPIPQLPSIIGIGLYGIALFLTVFLLVNIFRFARLKFYLSWWAYSFSIAAIGIATSLMYSIFSNSGGPEVALEISVLKWLSYALWVIMTLIIAFLLVRTGMAISRKEICIEES